MMHCFIWGVDLYKQNIRNAGAWLWLLGGLFSFQPLSLYILSLKVRIGWGKRSRLVSLFLCLSSLLCWCFENLFCLVVTQRVLVEMICSFFVASWTGVVRYHGPRPSIRPKQVTCFLFYVGLSFTYLLV